MQDLELDKYKNIWEHEIIDNFFSDDIYNQLLSIVDDISKEIVIENHSVYSFSNQIDKYGKITSGKMSKALISNIHENYHEFLLQILKKLSPKKTKLYDYSDLQIVVTGKDYKFPIHHDVEIKLLSGVIYLFPSKNSGTKIYKDKNGSSPYEIKWRQNRALVFSRKEHVTWHSYEGDGENYRVALIYNLNTHQSFKVSKIEGYAFKYLFKMLIYKPLQKLKNFIYNLIYKT